MSEPKKPKIKIGKPFVHPRTNAICVPYEFDTGETGTRNFTPEQFNDMDIEQVVKEHYDQVQKAKKILSSTKMNAIENKEIDW